MLVVDDLHVHLGRSHVLQGVSFRAEAREITALLGRNGVGKTTTLRTIMGLLRPSRGRIAWDDDDLGRLSPDRIVRRGLGWVPERRGNFATMTVSDNLRVAYHGASARWTERRDYVFGLFPILDTRQSQMAASLSGGEQQMLAIGKALITPRRFLLLDEPTQGLSPQVVEHLLGTLVTLRTQGVGVLLVEQNLEVALAVSDHVLLMEKGAIKVSSRRTDLDADTVVDLMGVRRRAAAG
jgi:branched-chain amino acid transport system ATP-binding protein